ncbi:MAG: septum site-determining protein MinC [Clostridiaceae bacterium]|nr:septum site-determining protein MinC [Clostridiaceae bacterium]
MADSEIIFKATKDSLILIMNEELSFDTIYNEIGKKLATAGKFFRGASLAVKYRGRKLSEEEIGIICELMTEKTEASVSSFEEDVASETIVSDKKENTAKEQEHAKQDKEMEDEHNIDSKTILNGREEEGITKFYRGTVRSGQLISFDGNVVILGDVNPGAEILASGNIIVMGCLRGTVHAGMYGNDKAIVASLNLQPVQLRIANIITRPPDEQVLKAPAVPEIAFVKDDMIYIERFLSQK